MTDILPTATLAVPRTVPKSDSALHFLADFGRALKRDLFGSYRPEKYYMRGRGPKWRERHGEITRVLQ
jgi:hypothetical protein